MVNDKIGNLKILKTMAMVARMYLFHNFLPDVLTNFDRYPEIHIAQYPLDMGVKNKRGTSQKTSKSLALTVNSEGKVNYEAIAKQGHRSNRIIQTNFQELIPLRQRVKNGDLSLDRPSQEVVKSTAEKTQAAIQKILDAKLNSSKPKSVGGKPNEPTYVRYTPSNMMGEASDVKHKQRIIKMVDIQEDPLAPPKFKHRKVPGGPPSPPAPVLRSPPRKLTAQDQEAWYIPPSVSNWKNPKGFTIALDKRVAADGRRFQTPEINDNFAKLSEALAVAGRKAREEIGQRAAMQQKLAEKENAAKEERLRQLAQQAREEREKASRGHRPLSLSRSPSGSPSRTPSRSPVRSLSRTPSPNRSEDERYQNRHSSSRKNYDDRSPSRDPPRQRRYRSRSYSGSDEEETAEERKRRRYVEEKKRDAEKELRRTRLGQERRIKAMAKDQNRDISEKVALGIARPSKVSSGESQFDSRLFSAVSSSTGFGSGYNEDQVYDKSLFSAREAVQSIYRARGGAQPMDDDGQSELDRFSKERRFDTLGKTSKGFQGADSAEAREGPVEFEKDDKDDPFGVSQMINEVQHSRKSYGLEKPGAREPSPSRDDERKSKKSRHS